jgi:hypothetical protein
MIRLLELADLKKQTELQTPQSGHRHPTQSRYRERVRPGGPLACDMKRAAAYLRVAHIYMLISMPTDTSTIFGAFQAIFCLSPFDRANSALPR